MPIRNILVVEDSPTDLKYLTDILVKKGYHVSTAETGEEALAKAKQLQPDLVLMDIVLPGQNGYQTCALIKQNPHLKSTPVIMLSSKDGVFDRARGRLAGSDRYLTKPFTKEGLIGAVNEFVKASVVSP